MRHRGFLSNWARGTLMAAFVLLTQTSCYSIFYSIFDVEFDNYALELGGDWPQHCVSRGIIPYKGELGRMERPYFDVNEEWCLSYHYPVGEFVLEASTIRENELHFQIRLPDGTLALPSITSNHPCEGSNGGGFFTDEYNESNVAKWRKESAELFEERKNVLLILLNDYYWSISLGSHPARSPADLCWNQLPPNPITVVITAVGHDFRIEVPVVVKVNGYFTETAL